MQRQLVYNIILYYDLRVCVCVYCVCIVYMCVCLWVGGEGQYNIKGYMQIQFGGTTTHCCINVLTVLRALLGARVSGETSVWLHMGQVKSFSNRCSRIPEQIGRSESCDPGVSHVTQK